MEELLIVVDVQKGFVNNQSCHVVEPIANFLQSWLDQGRMAVITRFVDPPHSKQEALLHWRCRDTNLAPEIKDVITSYGPSEQVCVATKSLYTALTSDVVKYMEAQQAKEIYLCGIATDVSVLKTAVDVFEYKDLIPFVFTDLCASDAGPRAHQNGLATIARFIGREQLIESPRAVTHQLGVWH